MKKLAIITFLSSAFLLGMSQTQNNLPAPSNPNFNNQPNYHSPQNPSGVTGSTGSTGVYPHDPPITQPVYPNGGYTGNTGLSGEMNDQRNRNIDYNKLQRGPSGPTGKKK